ncbi:cytochrome P450 [Schizopora paradoxa]|uniref:Cytochrome P450 n=1 Tax=Schizopora paradoxa TaxID=27342 RepID=A0A0H2SQ81_9AGAM|nr:cytochrome P450 [Schizopora paradoxa]
MEDPLIPFVAAGCVAAWVGSRTILDRARCAKRLPYPPGPPQLPVVGNLLQITDFEVYKTFAAWGKTYGGIVYFHLFGKQYIVLNDLKTVTDLFEHRNGRYSQRPDMPMVGELIGREENSIAFQKYGQGLKDARKLINSWIGKSPTNGLTPQITASCHKFMGTLLNDPEGFMDNARFALGSMSLKLTFGINCKTKDDPFIHLSEKMQHLTTKALKPGKWLVEFFPVCKLANVPSWMPMAEFKRWSEDAKRQINEAIHVFFDYTRRAVLNGEAEACWAAGEMLDSNGNMKTGEEAERLAVTCAAMYAGAIDTTISVLHMFFLLMARHPEIQRRAQEEIDKVVGSDRLPEMSDRESLPYLNRIIREALRFAPVAPLVVHSLDEDDVYEGFLIPKGTAVLANIWAILHNPEMYKDPEVFNPDRYIDTKDRPAEPDHSQAVFGFGRRACPGSHFALANLFLDFALILSAFNIKPIKNSAGEEVPPEIKMIDGHTRAVQPFKCVIEPRNAEKAQLVRQAVSAANESSY